MIFVDALIRFSGIAMLALVALFAVRDKKGWQSRYYLLAACLSVACLFLGFAPEVLRPPNWIVVAARFGDIPHLIFVWLFVLSLFSEEFKLRPIYVFVSILYCLPIFWMRLAYYGGFPPLYPLIAQWGGLTSLLIVGHLIAVVLKDLRDDLVSSRRRLRLYFVIIIAIVTVIATVGEVILLQYPFIPRDTVKIISIWPAILAATLWMLRFDIDRVRFSKPSPNKVGLTARDRALFEKLRYAMEEEHAYKDPSLTIVALARQLGVTQHRLRELINRELSMRNFSEYVNSYRLEATKLVLADPDQRHLSILTVALDAGFRSISPFNRAFKASEGMTPSDFRASVDL